MIKITYDTIYKDKVIPNEVVFDDMKHAFIVHVGLTLSDNNKNIKMERYNGRIRKPS